MFGFYYIFTPTPHQLSQIPNGKELPYLSIDYSSVYHLIFLLILFWCAHSQNREATLEHPSSQQ